MVYSNSNSQIDPNEKSYGCKNVASSSSYYYTYWRRIQIYESRFKMFAQHDWQSKLKTWPDGMQVISYDMMGREARLHSDLIGFHFIMVRSHFINWMILNPSIKVVTITSKERRTKPVWAVAMGMITYFARGAHILERRWVSNAIYLAENILNMVPLNMICIQQCTIIPLFHNTGGRSRAGVSYHWQHCDALHSLIQISHHFLKLWIWIKGW